MLCIFSLLYLLNNINLGSNARLKKQLKYVCIEASYPNTLDFTVIIVFVLL